MNNLVKQKQEELKKLEEQVEFYKVENASRISELTKVRAKLRSNKISEEERASLEDKKASLLSEIEDWERDNNISLKESKKQERNLRAIIKYNSLSEEELKEINKKRREKYASDDEWAESERARKYKYHHKDLTEEESSELYNKNKKGRKK